MASIRSTENKTEASLRKALWRHGLRYRKYDRLLPGRPDISFPLKRVAIFVDGDYWHGRILAEHGPEALASSFKTARRDWWVAKITRNAERDAYATAELLASGWTVIRLWESDVKKNVEGTAAAVAAVLVGESKTTERPGYV